MPTDIRPLRNVSNEIVLNAIRTDASMEYQRRIPPATEGAISDTVRALIQYRPLYNEFIDALVNRIGLVIARNTNWQNPLAQFKRGLLQWGDTIEEIQVGLLQAHIYDPDREYMEKDIFGTEIVDVQANFHKINRQNYYKITVNEPLLQRAFIEPNGLTTFVNKLLEAPSTSDQWDEFLLTCGLFAQYETNGGFYHVHVPDIADLESDEAEAKSALRKMRAMADNLTFLSTQYNTAHMPTFATRDELCIFVSPEFNAAVDVEALAGAFNMEKAEMYGRIYPIPQSQFGVEGCQAIMTVRDFFVIADVALETTTQFNPVSRQSNYFLHHWQVISASRFVPAVMFTTGPDEGVITVADSVVSVSTPVATDPVAANTTTDVVRGMVYQLDTTVTMSSGAEGAASWAVAGATSLRTHITPTGVLHVGGDEGAGPLDVTARSVYVDPDNTRKDPVVSSPLTLTVSGDVWPEWPEQDVAAEGEGITGIVIDDIDVPGFAAATTTYTMTVPPGTSMKKSDIYAEVSGSGDTVVSVTGNATAGYVVTVKYDPGTGAPTTYTVNVTVV